MIASDSRCSKLTTTPNASSSVGRLGDGYASDGCVVSSSCPRDPSRVANAGSSGCQLRGDDTGNGLTTGPRRRERARRANQSSSADQPKVDFSGVGGEYITGSRRRKRSLVADHSS